MELASISCEQLIEVFIRSCSNKDCRESNPQPDDRFQKNTRSRQCKSCHSRRNMEWNRKNPEKYRAINQRSGLRRGQENIEARRFWRIKTKYGLSPEQYKSLLSTQNGLCKICFQEETVKDRHGRTLSLSVDHCHTTGRIRGLLCSNCNTLLGRARDSVHILGIVLS